MFEIIGFLLAQTNGITFTQAQYQQIKNCVKDDSPLDNQPANCKKQNFDSILGKSGESAGKNQYVWKDSEEKTVTGTFNDQGYVMRWNASGF